MREILEPLQLTLGDTRPWFGCQGGAPGNAGRVNGQAFETAYSMREGGRERKLNYC